MSSTRSATNLYSKFFGRNTTEDATKTEPTSFMVGEGDLIDSIRDGRTDTYITLLPAFIDALIQPDGDMDVSTDWTPTNCSVATDNVTYLVGTGSVKMTYTDSTAQATAYMIKSFSSFDISDNKLCRFALYMTAANMAEAPLTGLSVTITDGSAVTHTVTITADDNDNLFADTNYMSDAWLYFSADMNGSLSIDYADIEDVKISVTVGTGTGTTPELNIDGLRFGPADCEFLYEFDVAFNPSMILLNGLDCKRYNISTSVDGVTYITLAESSSNTNDYILYFEALTTDKSYFRFTIGFKNQSGGLGTELANLLMLPFLYEFDNQPKIFPTKNNSVTQSENIHGAKEVNKIGASLKFDIVFDGFTDDQNNDLSFIETLFDRKDPLWFWLNGNNANTTFSSISTPWYQQNLYFVYDATTTLPLGHYNGQNDKLNMTNPVTMTLVEAAYKRSAL